MSSATIEKSEFMLETLIVVLNSHHRFVSRLEATFSFLILGIMKTISVIVIKKKSCVYQAKESLLRDSQFRSFLCDIGLYGMAF